MKGVLVIDKPEGLTSFAVVKKAGHTGTLDPLATGVLPVCLGEATKVAGMLLAEDKAYEAEAELGRRTDTLDVTGETTARGDFSGITRQQIEQALAPLTGEIDQVPPAYSAVRVDGKRAHELARQGRAPELKARRVVVQELELTRFEPPHLGLRIACSKGTYVRVLIDDLGSALGCGASMSALRRTRSGAFTLERAAALEGLRQQADAGELPLFSLDEALAHLPGVDTDEAGAHHLRHGQPLDGPGPDLPEGDLVRARLDGETIALGVLKQGQVWPRRIFHL